MENVSQENLGDAQGREKGCAQGNVEACAQGMPEVRNPEDCVTGRPPLTAEDMKGDPRYDVAAMLAIYNLTEEDMKDPGAALVSGGVQKMWAVARVMALDLVSKVRFAAAEAAKTELQKLQELEDDTRDPRYLEELRAWGEQEDAKPPRPLWQIVSGLGDANERDMSPKHRDTAILALLNVVAALARQELAAQRENPRPERSHMWDPLPRICFYLGIARAKLSRYCKELTGMAAHELIDKLRAVTLKDRLRAQFKNLKPKTNGSALEFYKALKEARRSPEWHRETWAMDFGFANYRRLYRACLLYYGKTPGQLEFEVIRELIGGDLSQSRDGANSEGKAEVQEHDVQFFTRSTPMPDALPARGKSGTVADGEDHSRDSERMVG